MNLLIFLPSNNDYLATYFISVIFGFLIGSIPFGYIIARIKGIDIRNYGSKNIGFNNVNRVLGLFFGIPVLILDIAKGFLPVFFSNQLGMVGALVGLGAILGHSVTPWLGFRGGKSVATTIGVMLALIPIALACGIGVFIIFTLIFSYISLASIALAVSLPIWVLILYRGEILIVVLTAVVAVLIIIRHKDNIKRIIKKTEPKIMLNKYFKTT
jgi:glycerol-3-phosphate acyltransferase PlsY